jgi:hypothetical protein
MAGSFVKILNPGYSALFTRDVGYTAVANVDGSTSANVFNPDADHPLFEGEWLTFDGTGKMKRACANIAYTGSAGAALAEQTSGATLLLASTPCFMYFQERGRYDAQLTRKVHVLVGPVGFEFRTQMIVCGTGDVGDKVFVTCCIDSSGRNVSALISSTESTPTPASGNWYAGVITEVHGANDATILFQPGFL